MNRLNQLFENKKKDILSIYFTAGYPELPDTVRIIKTLDEAGVDLIEVGMPYSDPLADGPTIQASGQKALQNGMHMSLLFDQLQAVRPETNMPIILMGYFNQVMQYGEAAFLQKCQAIGIDGLILPDLPLEVYEAEYKHLFEQYEQRIIFLITPQTDEARIRKIDALSNAFIYMVSNSSITGAKSELSNAQIDYFKRINAMELKNPKLIGFGISNHTTFSTACKFAEGAIIGSAFIKAITGVNDVTNAVQQFVKQIRQDTLTAAD